MIITSIVVRVSWVYVYVQIHQIVYIKHVLFGVCQLFLNIGQKEKKRKTKPSSNELRFLWIKIPSL